MEAMRQKEVPMQKLTYSWLEPHAMSTTVVCRMSDGISYCGVSDCFPIVHSCIRWYVCRLT